MRILSEMERIPDWADGVIYWTFRDERIHGMDLILIGLCNCGLINYYILQC